MVNINEYDGFGRFSPSILEPSHNNNVGQNTIIISGVPDPAKNKNGVDSTIKHDASKDTLLLNQRLSSNISKNPSSSPMIMLGNFIAYADNPKNVIEYFCNTRYGRSTKSPFNIQSLTR